MLNEALTERLEGYGPVVQDNIARGAEHRPCVQRAIPTPEDHHVALCKKSGPFVTAESQQKKGGDPENLEATAAMELCESLVACEVEQG